MENILIFFAYKLNKLDFSSKHQQRHVDVADAVVALEAERRSRPRLEPKYFHQQVFVPSRLCHDSPRSLQDGPCLNPMDFEGSGRTFSAAFVSLGHRS